MQQNGLSFPITIEDFEPCEGKPVNPMTFHTVRADMALIAQDSLVKREDIYILNAGKPYRLTVSLNRLDGSDSRIERVIAVSVKTPKGDFVKLDHLADDSGANKVFAFLDPDKTGLEELQRPCPLFGDVDQRLLLLKVKIEVVFGGLSTSASSEQSIWCRVVSRHRRLIGRRVLRLLQRIVAKFPTSVRRVGRTAVRFVKVLAKRLVGLG